MSTKELNMRMDVRGRKSTVTEIEQRKSRVLALLSSSPHRFYYREAAGVLVPCLVASIENWSEADIYELALQLEQDCIAVLDVATGQGKLVGPRIEGYGTFDHARFQRLKVEPISAAPVDPAKGNSLLKKLFGRKLPIVHEPEQPS